MGETIAYYRLRRGVNHLGFPDQSFTLCYREKAKMSENQALALGAKVCRRCQENSQAEWVKIVGLFQDAQSAKMATNIAESSDKSHCHVDYLRPSGCLLDGFTTQRSAE